MSTFMVEIKETLAKVIEVQAESIEQAISIVDELYKNEKIVLDANDFIDTEIKEYSQNL